MSRYGELPVLIKQINVDPTEMMLYQYQLIKDVNSIGLHLENRLFVFKEIIDEAIGDFIETFGEDEAYKSYIYLTAKVCHVEPNKVLNREGWHSDGFLTNDINYIWSNKFPTIFNTSNFNLTLDDELSMMQMFIQADGKNDVTFGNNALIRLNQFNIHRVAPVTESCFRSFVKISFSKDKYDLKFNTKNHLMDYDWEMRDRKLTRNIPQKL